MKRFNIHKNLIRAAVCAAGMALIFSVTACKELFANIEEDFSYWTTEPVITGLYAPSLRTSAAGVQCVPSASPVTLTLSVRNPKNFSFKMPGTGAPADIVTFASGVHDAAGTNPPARNTDYTLTPSSDGKSLELTYTTAFLKRYEHSNVDIGASIRLYSTDGRKFNQIYKFNLEANTPPPDPAPVLASADDKIALFKTAAAASDGNLYYVLCFKVAGLPGENVRTGVPLHGDLKSVCVSKNGGAETSYPVTLNPTHSDFDISNLSNTAFISKNDVVQLSSSEAGVFSGGPQPDTRPSEPWVLYLKTDIPVGGVAAKYGIRLFDGKLYSSQAVQTIGKRALPAPKVFAHTDMDNTADSGVYTEKGATDASGNEDLNATNSAAHAGSEADPIPVYSAYGKAVKLAFKKADGSSYPAGVTVSPGVQLISGSDLEGSIGVHSASATVTLPSPKIGGGEAVYKVTFTATGEGFDDSTTRTLYYKVCRKIKAVSSTLPMWKILKEAITKTSAGGTVVIDGEIKATNASGNNGKIGIDKNLTIKKADGASSAVINANKNNLSSTNKNRIFEVSSGTLTLENITLQGGISHSGAVGGGMLIYSGAVVSLTDCRIIECVSDIGNGGAVYTNGTLSVTRTSIGGTISQEGNKARYGGGIYVAGGSCTLTETKILMNSADGGTVSSNEGKGGGIYVAQGGTCSLIDVTAVQGNRVKDGSPNKGAGAGIYVESGAVCNIRGGTKIDEGNDVYLMQATVPLAPSQSAKLTVTAPLTGTHIVAKITPGAYETNRKIIVNAASGINLGDYADRFKIREQQNLPPLSSTVPWKLIYKNDALVLRSAAPTIIQNGIDTWQTLKDAIEAPTVEDGDEFLVRGIITATNAPNNHSAIFVTKKITVKGDGASPSLNANKDTLGQDAHRIFVVANGGELTLENITLKGGKAAGSTDDEKCGGGIFIKAGCKAKLTNCTVKACEASSDGGGIYSLGELTVDGCTVGGNSASDGNKANRGGGICVDGGALTLKTATIRNNRAVYGGAVGVTDKASVTMESASIMQNTATFLGGGVLVDRGASFTMNGGEIENNTGNGGGGVYVHSGTFTLSGGEIENNTADAGNNGGGIYVDSDGKLEIKGGSIKSNTTIKSGSEIGNGGGVYVYGSGHLKGTLDMSGGSIEENKAGIDGSSYEGNGGGVYINGGKMKLSGGEIKNNNAGNGGGIGINDAAELLINGDTVIGGSSAGEGNTAKKSGGGIYVGKKSVCKINEGVTVRYNKVSEGDGSNGGGGIYIYGPDSSPSDTDMGSLTVIGTEDKPVIIKDCTVAGSLGTGGGIYSRGKLLLKNAKLENNKATDSSGQAGGIFVGGNAGSCELENTEITGCEATRTGGGVLMSTNKVLVLKGSSEITPSSENVKGKNDVFLGTGASVSVDDSLTAPLLGRITPISYNEGTKVLKGEITNGTPQNYKRFTVTPKDLGGGATQQWYVGSDGCLTTASP